MKKAKNSKTFLVIGVGTFGLHLIKNLINQKCEVMAVDSSQEALEPVLNIATSARIADCTNRAALESFDIPGFDACFVCVGDNFQISLQVTDLLKELGAKKVITKADSDVQEKFLLRNGADEVVYPERDMAESLAVSESSDSIFDCVHLGGEYGIYEITVNDEWVGKTLRELNFRAAYSLSVLAVKNGDKINPMLQPDYIFRKEEHVMVLGRQEDIRKVI